MRYAAKVDDNQRAIVEALRAIGATVYAIGRPVDLLVGYRRINTLLEIKNVHGKDAVSPRQQDFIDEWRGQVAVVRNPEEAIAVLKNGR